MNSEELPEVRRTPAPNGSTGLKLRGPWAQWDVLSRGDARAGVLAAAAIFCTAGSLFQGSSQGRPDNPVGFIWVAPLTGALFFVALIAMFTERERHGFARILLATGSAVLAVSGFYFMREVSAARLAVCYWLPAILAISGALALV